MRAILISIVCALTLLLIVGWFGMMNALSMEETWWIQVLLVIFIVVLIFLWVRFDRLCLLLPMQQIADWAAMIRQGDLQARVTNETNAMASLYDDVNRLGEWLCSMVESNDQQLRDKTRILQRQSTVLKSLYDLAVTVNQVTDLSELVKQSIELLLQVVNADKVVANVYDRDGDLRISEQVGSAEGMLETNSKPYTITIPLQFKDRVHGNINIFHKYPIAELPGELTQALFSMGRSIGLAIEKSDQDRETVRLFRIEERARIANELHDSLAQTVASLRFQVRVLDDLLHQENESAIWEQMERVEGMLDEAHAELRGLIGYFRTPIDPRGLMPALKTVISRFRTETGIAIFFHNQWGDLSLPAEWEMHLVRIIQEALANVRKHSEAQMVRILFSVQSQGSYLVLIEDDGKGLIEQVEIEHPGEHIGLTVMRERAAQIGAELTIESEAGEGTRILVSFNYDDDSVTS